MRNATQYLEASRQQNAPRNKKLQRSRTVLAPLTHLPDDLQVPEIVPPMELHLLRSSIVCLKSLTINSKLPIAAKCAQTTGSLVSGCSVSLNGNQCAKLLDSIDLLEQMLRDCESFAAMLRPRTPGGLRRCNCTILRANVNLDANITLKVHAVLDPILPFFMSVDNTRRLGY